jgi:electron transfer flavoprotein alpha subunit
MDVLVLVKYVADVDNIPEDAWDRERGTLKRNLLRMVANPLDDRALQLGLEIVYGSEGGRYNPPGHDLHSRAPDEGRVVVLSMGPPQAEEICRRALAHGAERAILLSDSAFAGADTIATARTIAAAVRKMISDGVIRDPLVLAGMQSPDGDTAQVPVQVAALLGFPLIPYAAGWSRSTGEQTRGEAEQSGLLAFETLQPRGRSTLVLNRAPALVAVTKYLRELPFHTTLDRMAAAAEADITVWDRYDLEMPEADLGLAGSLTRVVRIFSPEKKERGAYRVEFGGERNPLEELPAVLRELEEFLRAGGVSEGDASQGDASTSKGDAAAETGSRGPAAAENGAGSPAAPPAVPAWYQGECAVLCERDGQEISAGSRELLGAAASLAETLGTRATALLPGELRPGEREMLAAAGADHILSVSPPTATAFVPEEIAATVVDAVTLLRPQILLVPASLTGRATAPLIAARLGAGLTADCTGLEIADYEGRAGGRQVTYGSVLFQTRPALGGNVMATIVSLRGRENQAPQIATARPGVFRELKREAVTATVGRLPAVHPDNRVSPMRPGGPGVSGDPDVSGDRAVTPAGESVHAASAPEEKTLDECPVIVSVGLGIGGAENVDLLARPLVRALEKSWGVAVGLGCSRAAMEAGYLPYSSQVGQTGKTVKPLIYIALGISGAVQHRVGMEKAGRVLAINSDGEAPLLSYSDYVIHARCTEAVPLLLKLLDPE